MGNDPEWNFLPYLHASAELSRQLTHKGSAMCPWAQFLLLSVIFFRGLVSGH